MLYVRLLCNSFAMDAVPGNSLVGSRAREARSPLDVFVSLAGAVLASELPEWVWSEGQLGIPPWMLQVQRIRSSASPERSEIRSSFQKIMDL